MIDKRSPNKIQECDLIDFEVEPVKTAQYIKYHDRPKEQDSSKKSIPEIEYYNNVKTRMVYTVQSVVRNNI